MLLGSYRFGALDIQNRELDPAATPVLVLPAARYMDSALQQKIVAYVKAGGGLFLYGEVPQSDMEGNACTVLAEALGLQPAGYRHASAFYYLSLRSEGWAAPHAEVRTHIAQVFEKDAGEPILRVVGTGEACGFDLKVGAGRAIVVAASYPCDVPLIRTILEKLGAKAALLHDDHSSGTFMTSAASGEGERFLHILNLDGFTKTLHLTENGNSLMDGLPIVLGSKEALMLPLGVSFGDTRIVYATAEISKVDSSSITFRLTQAEDVIVLETDRQITPSEDYSVSKEGKRVIIKSRKQAAVDDQLTVRWQ